MTLMTGFVIHGHIYLYIYMNIILFEVVVHFKQHKLMLARLI